ncbi:hypothetical protein Sjap_009952 [Stephania japonica]|uniref:TFIIS N-terminal domain-containing protein n=1 Tax=Stephania japonica TaxID=461633 RepID=A0AAP0JA90_9MAGN
MTLEDFFTLTEMKDGLMALSRVEELVSVMRKDKDNSLKNVSEEARQWVTVASTLAATENQDSLNHFIRLDGLYFLNWWLQEAQKFSNDTNESSVEESISALLGALKRLPIDKEKSLSSGIGETVKNLFGHKSCMVQERARALYDSWNPQKDNDADHHKIEKDVECHVNEVKNAEDALEMENGSVELKGVGDCHNAGSFGKDCNAEKASNEELQSSRGMESLQPGKSNGAVVSLSSAKDDCNRTLSCAVKADEFLENVQGSSNMSIDLQGSSSIKEMSTCPAEKTSMGVESSPLVAECNTLQSPDVPNSKDLTTDVKGSDCEKLDTRKEGDKKTSLASISAELEQVSSTERPKEEQQMVESSVPCKNDADEKFSSKKNVASGPDDDVTKQASELKQADHGIPNHSRIIVDNDCMAGAAGCYSSKCTTTKPEYQDEESIKAVDSEDKLANEPLTKVGRGKGYATVLTISRPDMGTKLSKLDGRRSNMEFDYGVDDALEVARQVAKEVEQEVVDYREQFCSSSEKISEAGVLQPSSPDSINGNSINDEDSQHLSRAQSETSNQRTLTGEVFSANGEHDLIDIPKSDKAEDSMPETDSSLVTEALQMPEKGLCDLDLNKEICSEEMDPPRFSNTAPITIVSASKALAPSLPAVPIHFGGELGWKGSAATSAFRTASPRTTVDGEKTVLVDGGSQISKRRLQEKAPSVDQTGQSSKKRKAFLDFDLNVAEGNNDAGADLPPAKQIAFSSELASRESSIEVNSRRAERLKFDLNRVDDHEDAPTSDLRTEARFQQHHLNGSASPASSSSSRQPSIRNINLNDNPSCFDDSSDRPSALASYSLMDPNGSGVIKQDDPIISIMGTRVEINRKDFAPQTRSFLPNGRVSEFPFGSKPSGGVATQPPVAYAQGHAFSGFNLTPGSCMSMPPTIFGLGSSPCVVDSRGTTMLPQLMGAPVDVPPSFPRQHFLMSMPNSQASLNRVGIAEPSLDLNSGFSVMDPESRERGGYRQLFTPGQSISIEGPGGSASQPLNLGVGMKRKEPEGGLELYNVGYKHQTQWHL